MISWIRWSGLAVFGLLTFLLLLIWLMLMPWLLEWGIERTGERVFQAKVEVGDVDLSLSPLGFSVSRLQVANKDKPMTNLFSFDTANLQAEFMPLLMGKLIVPEMRVQGLRAGTQREYSGALDDAVRSKAASEDNGAEQSTKQALSKLGADLPDVDELLARESLRTITLGKQFETSYRETKAKIESSVNELPDQQKLKRLEQEMKELSKGKIKNLSDFQKKKEEFDRLKSKVKTIRNQVKNARKTVSEGISTLGPQYQALRRAPEEDLARLREQYSFDSGGAINLLSLLAGGEAGEFARQALEYYQLADGFLSSDEGDQGPDDPDSEMTPAQQRAEGRFIHFNSTNPLPEFWIAKAYVDYALSDVSNTDSSALKDLAIEITDISKQQNLTGKPLRFQAQMNRDGTASDQTLIATGAFDRRNARAADTFYLELGNWPLSQIDLGSHSLKLAKANAHIELNAGIVDSMLELSSSMALNQTRFESDKSGDTATALMGVLKKVEAFDLALSANGALSSPDVSIESDLDKRLKDALQAELGERAAGYEEKLKQKLQSHMGKYAGDYAQYIDKLSLTESSLEDQSGMLEGLLDQQMDSYKSEIENKAKSKAEDALKDQLKKLF